MRMFRCFLAFNFVLFFSFSATATPVSTVLRLLLKEGLKDGSDGLNKALIRSTLKKLSINEAVHEPFILSLHSSLRSVVGGVEITTDEQLKSVIALSTKITDTEKKELLGLLDKHIAGLTQKEMVDVHNTLTRFAAVCKTCVNQNLASIGVHSLARESSNQVDDVLSRLPSGTQLSVVVNQEARRLNLTGVGPALTGMTEQEKKEFLYVLKLMSGQDKSFLQAAAKAAGEDEEIYIKAVKELSVELQRFSSKADGSGFGTENAAWKILAPSSDPVTALDLRNQAAFFKSINDSVSTPLEREQLFWTKLAAMAEGDTELTSFLTEMKEIRGSYRGQSDRYGCWGFRM